MVRSVASATTGALAAATSAVQATTLCIGALILAGCAARPLHSGQPGTAAVLPTGMPAVELTAVPFFAQTDYQCGPAALAAVLVASGSTVTPDDLAPQVYLPGRRGSLQLELVAATRRAGRLPWVLGGDAGRAAQGDTGTALIDALPALVAELAAGHPVLVLMDTGFYGIRRWHYAVVVGVDPAAGTATLRSGREPRRQLGLAEFQRRWAAGGSWGLVVLGPGLLPASGEPGRIATTLADAEGLLPAPDLAATWSAAVTRWPDEPGLRFGAGNAAAAAGDTTAAEGHFRALLALAPDYLPALNNLADLLLDRDCAAEAVALARRARDLAADPATPGDFRAAVTDTWQRAERCAPVE